MNHSIIQIDDILISSEIVTEYFACDYAICKGACCIVGDSGAPLYEEECDILEQTYDAYAPFMSREGKDVVSEKGFFEVDCDGDIVTPLLKTPCNGENYPCVYTRFEESGCFCAIERAYYTGTCPFKKPISCRLYPIRVSRFSNGTIALNLHRWELCTSAFEKGKKEGIHVYEFLKDPIIFNFGEEFYSALCEAAKTFNAES